MTPAAAVGRAPRATPAVAADGGRARSSTRATRAASAATTDEEMDVDEEMDMDEQRPFTKEEKRAAKARKQAENEARRVAMDGQRATLQSCAEAGMTAREAYDHLCKAKGSAAMSKQAAYKR